MPCTDTRLVEPRHAVAGHVPVAVDARERQREHEQQPGQEDRLVAARAQHRRRHRHRGHRRQAARDARVGAEVMRPLGGVEHHQEDRPEDHAHQPPGRTVGDAGNAVPAQQHQQHGEQAQQHDEEGEAARQRAVDGLARTASSSAGSPRTSAGSGRCTGAPGRLPGCRRRSGRRRPRSTPVIRPPRSAPAAGSTPTCLRLRTTIRTSGRTPTTSAITQLSPVGAAASVNAPIKAAMA